LKIVKIELISESTRCASEQYLSQIIEVEDYFEFSEKHDAYINKKPIFFGRAKPVIESERIVAICLSNIENPIEMKFINLKDPVDLRTGIVPEFSIGSLKLKEK